MFASPFATLKHVVKTKNASSIPINLSLVIFASSVLWVATGLLDGDYFITGLNLAGVVLGAIQIVLHCMYRPGRGIAGRPQRYKRSAPNRRVADVQEFRSRRVHREPSVQDSLIAGCWQNPSLVETINTDTHPKSMIDQAVVLGLYERLKRQEVRRTLKYVDHRKLRLRKLPLDGSDE
ncbi:unnamed protein product [Phytophthora lilii]|uniref:Sugar transporter SWEET1 n=1 Tax=Phytophthora lilii TaxID=2077276 RepID=A0A9W6UCB9_9STRA|nr:unnamed protein product [Phytophthora lilii]